MTNEGANTASEGRGLFLLSTIISGTISGLLGNVLTRLLMPTDIAGAADWPWMVALAAWIFASALTFHYWTVCGYGSFPKGTAERARYNRLRTSLSRGGKIGQVYEEFLRTALNSIDLALGDKVAPKDGRAARWFGLVGPAHIWTAQSYDRCLLFAVVYPVLTIAAVWGVSAHVGPAEEVLRFPRDAGILERAAIVVAVFLMLISWVQFMRRSRWQNQVSWVAVTLIGLAVILQLAGAGRTTWALAFALSVAFALAVAAAATRLRVVPINIAGSGTITFCGTAGFLVAFAGAGLFFPREGFGLPLMTLTSFALALSAAGAVCTGLVLSLRRGAFGAFLGAWTLFFWMAAVASPLAAGNLSSWTHAGPLILFLLLLPLVNAPFDWFAVGLTRGLLRRGLEKGGWRPLAYAIVDLVASAFTVAFLAVMTLLTVQTFETLTTHTVGDDVVRVQDLLRALQEPGTRTEPEYWWIYAMLFSTFIPSVINLGLGTLSLLRGIPGLHEMISRRMPMGREVLLSERLWICPVLAIQLMVSGAIALACMTVLFWTVLVWEVPYLGHSLVSLLQDLAAAQLPAALFGDGPYH